MLTDPDGCWFLPPCGAREDGGVDRVTDRKVDSDGGTVTVFNLTVLLNGKEALCKSKSGYFTCIFYFTFKKGL